MTNTLLLMHTYEAKIKCKKAQFNFPSFPSQFSYNGRDTGNIFPSQPI